MLLNNRQKSYISRLMQLILVGLLASGLYNGSSKVILNSAIGLAVTLAPALIERNYSVSLGPWISLWITSAVFFHALGSFGFYGAISWWDHLTHALSASVVAGIGYASIRTLDLHSDSINLPNRFMFVFILMTVIAFGVVWELFEFGLDIIADITGLDMPLAQHGLQDTMKDMMFNTLGATLVALFGQLHLTNLSQDVLNQIKERTDI